jgi:hypothetical protein
LLPYCHAIHREPQFKNRLRPDIGFRLKVLPKIPLLIECKNFVAGNGLMSNLCDGIAQASNYAEMHRKHPAFVGPLFAQGPTQLEWLRNPLGAMLLLAAEFNVGIVFFTPENAKYRDKVGTLLLGGQAIATFTINQHGDPDTRLHSDHLRLLTFKERAGSQTLRNLRERSAG